MDIITKSLNFLKSLTAETISNAGSGHTGSALGASSILLALFHDHLIFDATGLNYINRDRFVLSAGHASALYYSLLHLFGYDISIDDLKNFRKFGSKTPGHPEYKVVPGVETTTGPLGQGVANAVGMAISAKHLNANFNQIDPKIYCFLGDGCLMEGVANEACSLAGTLKLDNLILLYDDNEITIDGSRQIACAENTAKKFEAMGWNVITVSDGNNYFSCTEAIGKAKTLVGKPTIIIFKTIIGIGTKKQGTSSCHAYPLPPEELEIFKTSLGVTESFYVPQDVYDFCQMSTKRNNEIIDKWNKSFDINKYNKFFEKNINFSEILKSVCTNISDAGRNISGNVLNLVSEFCQMLGGTADLGASTKAVIKNGGDFSSENPLGKNIHFGIREHAMGAICNGIALFEPNFTVFDSTFAVFSNYMLPALRCRAMMGVPVFSYFSHDSINIGEDGPTHQPIEQLGCLRLIYGLNVFRPACTEEVVSTFEFFIEKKLPTVMLITKSKIGSNKGSKLSLAQKGGYTIFETGENLDIVIIATGTEVDLAINIAKDLLPLKTRVVSMPCLSLFESQSQTYKNKVLGNPKLTVAIEASNDPVWHKYTGKNGLVFGVNSYMKSGNGTTVYEQAGFSVSTISKKIKSHYKSLI